MTFLYNNQSFRKRRQELRKNQTEEENILWQKLRGRKLNNLKFHRQYSVGPYILDFFCPETRLGIELDGDYHKNEIIYDKERELFLKDKDIKVIRFRNEEVLNEIKKVMENIINQIPKK